MANSKYVTEKTKENNFMNARDIQAKIKKLEEEKAKLLPLRKEEIFNVLQAAGGLGLDNSLIAGLSVYASSEEGKKSQFLKDMVKLGKKYLPRHRQSRVLENSSKVITSLQSRELDGCEQPQGLPG